MIIPDGFGQLNLRFGGDALPRGAEITMGFEIDGFAGDAQDMADAIAANFEETTDLWACTINSVEAESVRVKVGPNDVGPIAEAACDGVGTYSGADSVPQSSYLIRKFTALGGRQGTGRIYWPGPPLIDVQLDGTLGSNLLGDQNDGWATWAGKMVADSLIPVLLRAEGSPVQIPANITSFACSTRIATQRRRLRK